MDRNKDGKILARDCLGHLSFRLGLIFILMSFAVIPIVANLGINLPKILSVLEESQREISLFNLKENYYALDRKIVQRQESIRLLTDVPGVRDILKGKSPAFSRSAVERRLSGLMRNWFQGQSDVRSVTLYDLEGSERFKLERDDGHEALVRVPDNRLSSDRQIVDGLAWITKETKNSFVVMVQDIIKFHDHLHSHNPLIRVGAPVRDLDGRILGMGVVDIDISNFLSMLKFDLLATGAGLLMDWSVPHDSTAHEHHEGDLFKLFPGMKEAVKAGRPVVVKDIHGVDVAWFPILSNTRRDQNLWVGRPVDLSKVANVRSMIFSRVAVTSLAALALVLLLVARYSRALDRYRQELVSTLRKVLLGQGLIKLDWKRPPEMAELAGDLNQLFEKFIENDKKRQEALRELSDLSEKMRLILDNAAEGIIEVNRKNEITFVNQAACTILGFTRQELMGNDLHSVIHYMKEDRSQFPREDCPFCKALEEGNFNLFKEDIFWTRNGRPLNVEYVTAPVKDHDGRIKGLVMCLRDVSAKKEAEEKARIYQEQLRQAQKMEAIGTLAGGVAHDFNNLLTAIRGYSELLAMSLEGNEAALNQLKSIQKAADRAASLVRQLLAFSRKQVAEKRPVDLNQLVEDQQRMLKRLIGEDIELEIKPCEEKTLVHADPNMLAQVIMNMVVNARDALDKEYRRKISIQVDRRILLPEKSAENPEGRS
jgi:PAS domain S-box-containing protein